MPSIDPVRRDDEFLVVTDAVRVPMSEFSFTFMRSSGPGGQNVNKVSTKARLRWPVAESESLDEAIKERFLERYRSRITTEGDFLLTSQRYRDQAHNVTDCLEKLREMLAEVVEPPK
ncbi:MAG: alternative ribosome rescue aminoacyl-tRNA hydrolase ArfB, partial [Planctomycetaceae bacterium]